MSFENELDSIPTSNSAYCFVSNSQVHCIPIDALNAFSDIYFDNTNLLSDVSDFTPNKLYLSNKNLLYSLNNPSISDVEDSNNGNDDEFLISSSPSHEEFLKNLNNFITYSIYLPKFIVNLLENLSNDFSELRTLLCKIFNWTSPSKINLNQLTGGITNMLLSIQYESQNYLVRIYGHGTNLIIDRHREFISHLILNSLNLAPPIYARFKNGVIYGFLPGKSLKPQQLKNPNIYPLVAQLLGTWHSSIDSKLIENGVEKLRDYTLSIKKKKFNKKLIKNLNKKKFINNFWELIEQWINIVPINSNLIESFNNHLTNIDVNENNLKQVILDEFAWLKLTLENVNSPTVSCHCDLLSGNVIIPDDYDLDKPLINLPKAEDNPIKFIDYEYMLPGPRAFDIANHFAEWQGFDCDRSAIPEPTSNNPIFIKFVKGYLNNNDADPIEINQLINEIIMFYGLPGFYWGIWAMIQSEISNIDFDYFTYGSKRLEEYWDWKKNYLKNSKGD